MNTDGTGQGQGTMGLVRETADGLGHLVALHVKLARCELTQELRSMAGRAGLIAVLTALLLIGYALAMAGVAVFIGGNRLVGGPLVMVGIGHVAVSGGGLFWCQRRTSARRVLEATGIEAKRTLAVLGHGR
jgi:Putative Actinobacterial Holin-X, holin superfamily III